MIFTSLSQNETQNLWTLIDSTKYPEENTQQKNTNNVKHQNEISESSTENDKSLKYHLDINKLKELLNDVPVKNNNPLSDKYSDKSKNRVVIPFPNTDGEMEYYEIIEIPIFHPDLAKKY